MITKENALQIAQENAGVYYRDLSVYDVEIKLVEGNWQVDYEFRDENIDGGGPHYLISGTTGEIISFRFEQ